MHNDPMLSVVIPVKNGGSQLERCLGAIRAQQLDDQVEIIVVDSGSTDQSVAVAQNHGAVVIEIAASSFTHGGSRNLGASKAAGDLLVFISQDAVPVGEKWLARLAAPLRADMTLAGVYGRQIAHPGAAPPEIYFLDFLYGPHSRRQSITGAGELSMDATLFSNVNSAIRRTAWEQFPFADHIVMSEDQEWSRRALLAGYALQYEAEAVVRHSHEYTLKAAFQRFFDSGMSSEHAYMGNNAESKKVLRRRSIAYAIGEIAWLWHTRRLKWLPYTVAYETAKMLGLLLGINHARLPRGLERRLSGIPAAWSEPHTPPG